jgi:hypothetical protein
MMEAHDAMLRRLRAAGEEKNIFSRKIFSSRKISRLIGAPRSTLDAGCSNPKRSAVKTLSISRTHSLSTVQSWQQTC